MTPPPTQPPDREPASNAKLWLQAACIFAAAVAFGVIYNGASPLGVRPQALPMADAGNAVPEGGAAKPAAVHPGFFNETVAMTLDAVPGNAPPPRANRPAAVAAAPQPAIPKLTWPAVQALLGAGKIVLVDARAKAAFDLGHIPGAVLLPSNASAQELQAFAAKYPKDTALVIYCSSTTCGASQSLARQLTALGGFNNISEMPGGFAEYTVAQASATPPKS